MNTLSLTHPRCVKIYLTFMPTSFIIITVKVCIYKDNGLLSFLPQVNNPFKAMATGGV